MTPKLAALHTRREIALSTLDQAKQTGIGFREAYITYHRVLDEIVAEWSREDRKLFDMETVA